MWRHLNIFRAGAMDQPAYAFSVFRTHCETANLATLDGLTVLELGPGDSLLTALYARSMGATRTWLIDVGQLASKDITLFAQAEQRLSELNLPVPGVGTTPSMEAALERLNSTYLTEGLKSLETVPDGQVDFLFSQAVLEHIGRA